MLTKCKICGILFFIYASILSLNGQEAAPDYDAAHIRLNIKKLKVLGSALYVAAHPDDENTALLAYLAGGRLVNTAYLSLTRGEGGQNLVGTETGDPLGILRTGELLAARRIDGAIQFFGGAEDFGYSKSPEETLAKWDREKILAKMVGICRSFRPDIIITRFSSEQGGHGHHLASAILAREAFSAAADPGKFPGQLDTSEVWQSKRLLWNAWRPDTENRGTLIAVDLGLFNPLLGKSYPEIAAESRSMHKSQGFGSAPVRGSYLNYFEHTAGAPARTDIFDGIDLSWNRIEGGGNIEKAVTALERAFDPEDPSASIPALLAIRNMITRLPDSVWKTRKQAETDRLIRMCSGLWLDIHATDYAYVRGDSIGLEIHLVNRGNFPVKALSIGIPDLQLDTLLNTVLANNSLLTLKSHHLIPHQGASKPEAGFRFIFDTTTITYRLPITYAWTDRVKGEQVRPVMIMPPLTVHGSGSMLFFSDSRPRTTGISVKSWTAPVKTTLSFPVPAGWRIEPGELTVTIDEKYGEQFLPFTVFPPETAAAGKLVFFTDTPLQRHQTISYDHISTQLFLTTGDLDLVRAPLKVIPLRIGYIMGSGDEIPDNLRQLGYPVAELSDTGIEQDDLQEYDVLIAGTRAFNTRRKLHIQKAGLMRFVEGGGTFIVLHNTRFGLQPDNIGPYPFSLGRDRVSVEDAPVEFIRPEHRLLHFPNVITADDFKGWVQERGLYFASEWDPRYQTIISSSDPGEEPKAGGILYASYGKGHYVYAAYSWFRQLPAGVPGAYRLFVNLISAGAGR